MQHESQKRNPPESQIQQPCLIHDAVQFASVIGEISEWDLQKRRAYISEMEIAFGLAAAQQLKDGLTELWKNK